MRNIESYCTPHTDIGESTQQRYTQPSNTGTQLAKAMSQPTYFNVFFFYNKFSPNLLNGRIDEDRARSKQSL